MKNLTIKILKGIVKGVVLGNFMVNITYVILALLYGQAFSGITQDITNNLNYIRMVLFASVTGILFYTPIMMYDVYLKSKLDEEEKGNIKDESINSYVKRMIGMCIRIFGLGIVLFGAAILSEKIYYVQEFNKAYIILIMLVFLILSTVVLGSRFVRSEIRWINENLKNRNIKE